jgi:hypothetical protein
VTLEILSEESCLILLQARNEVAIFYFDSIRERAALVIMASQFIIIRLQLSP